MDRRYSFTAQFLKGAALFAGRARGIEETESPTEEDTSAHRSYVVAAVIQSAAALEAAISEVLLHGPGHHLGSSGVDADAREFLRPMFDSIDGTGNPLRRYDLVLHLLHKPSLDHGANPHQAADLLVKLRNELVHYKSQWEREMEGKKLLRRLENLRFEKPPFADVDSTFFPHKFLSSSCASWAVTTTVNLINQFYSSLAIGSPLAPHLESLRVPPVRSVGKPVPGPP